MAMLGYLAVAALVCGVSFEIADEKSPASLFTGMILGAVWPATLLIVLGMGIGARAKRWVS